MAESGSSRETGEERAAELLADEPSSSRWTRPSERVRSAGSRPRTAARAPVAVSRRESRHPVAVFLLLACFAGGVLEVATGKYPASVVNVLVAQWLRYAWSAMLIAGGGLTLAGVAIRDAYNGLRLESVGMLSVSLAAYVYSFAIIATGGVSSALVFLLIFGFATATGARWWSVSRVLARARELAARRAIEDYFDPERPDPPAVDV